MAWQSGAFPDGGAGICLPWVAAQAFTSKLEGVVHKHLGGNDAALSGGLPHYCAMWPGHWDDVVTGLCFQEMNLLPYRGIVSPLGQTLFNSEVLPHLSDTSGHCLGSIEDWLEQGRLHDLFLCSTRYRDCSAVRPQCWVNDMEAISFHGYKNASDLQRAYRYLRGRYPSARD